MTQTNLERRTETLLKVRDVRKLIAQAVIGINWASDELQTTITERTSRRHGPGEEERGVKKYELGDKIGHIHLAATLASTDPDEILIRTFFQSRVTRLNVLVDVGPSLFHGTHNTLKSTLAAAVGGAALQSAIEFQDIPAAVTFSDRPHTVRVEDSATDILFESLIHFVEDGKLAVEKPAGGGIAKAYEAIRSLDRSVTVVVSDFAFTSASDWDALRLLGIQHDTIAVFVQDPRERELPEVPWPGAVYEFEDYQGTKKSLWVTPSKVPTFLGMDALVKKLARGKTVTSRQEWAENFDKHEKDILARLKKFGITPVVVSTDRAKDDVRKFVRTLARQTR